MERKSLLIIGKQMDNTNNQENNQANAPHNPHARRKQSAPSAAKSTAILQNTASANGKPMPKASAQKYVPPAARWQTSCMATLTMTAR